MAKSIIALTDVLLRDRRYDKGTEFAVAEEPDAAAISPVEVDTATAAAWLRDKWAVEKAADKPGKAGKAS